MGTNQTREITPEFAPLDFPTTDGVFSSDVVLIIFSNLHSDENIPFLIHSFSMVCNHWRMIIRFKCKLDIRINCEKFSDTRSMLACQLLQYFQVNSLSVRNVKESNISVICDGPNAVYLKELDISYNNFNDTSLEIIASKLKQ